MAAGLLAGAANYALLAGGCKRFLARRRGGILQILCGILIPVMGLVLLAWRSPGLLVWFGCAVGGTLVLLSIGQMICIIIKKKR